MEKMNAVSILEKMPQKERLVKLIQIAIQQTKVLQKAENRKPLMQMNNITEHKNIPELRFPEFSNDVEWERKSG